MANLKEENKWEEGIYQLEVTDPVVGGIDGISNKQAKQLANRTKFLKESIDTLADGKLGKEETAVDSQKLDGKTADAFAKLNEENTFTKSVTIGSEGILHANNNDSHFLIEAKNKGQAIGLGTPKPDGSPVWHYFTHEGFRTSAYVDAGVLKIKGINTDEIYLKKDEASDGTPIGAYLAWSSESKIPTGYLLCDGRSLKKSEYKELFAVIGYTYGGSGENFNIPKFNDGRFMRSTGGNAAALGIVQQDELKSHKHYQYSGGNVGYTDHEHQNINPAAQWVQNISISAKGWTSEVGGNETRPYNSSVIVLIKVKDVKEPNKNEVDKSIYATESKAGIVKIKNSITGVQEDVAVSEKAVANIASIGINQTWQDVTSQRQIDITYTNTTNKPIYVVICGGTNISSARAKVFVNDIHVGYLLSHLAVDNVGQVSFIVPVGGSYKIDSKGTDGTGVSNWLELR